MDRLEELFKLQRDMSSRFIEIDKFIARELPHQEVQRITMQYMWCIVEEAVEMARNYPHRKWWKRGNDEKPHDEGLALEEYADIWLFLIAIGLINGWDAKTVHEAIMKKDKTNQVRFEKTDGMKY